MCGRRNLNRDVVPERGLRRRNATGMLAADTALERVEGAGHAVSVSRGAPNRQLACSMQEGDAGTWNAATPV
jgi:hypothetical protein